MTTCSSSLAWRIPWTEEAWRATVHAVRKELHTNERLNNDKTFLLTSPSWLRPNLGQRYVQSLVRELRSSVPHSMAVILTSKKFKATS